MGRAKTKGFLLERFIESMYQGSASSLMMQLLGNKDFKKRRSGDQGSARKMEDEIKQ
jgi:hypothetical protein